MHLESEVALLFMLCGHVRLNHEGRDFLDINVIQPRKLLSTTSISMSPKAFLAPVNQ